MPYLILSDRGGEFDRRELRAGESLVVGRSLECDVHIRDILLSRRHCKIESFNDRWVVTDLDSKNGTLVGNERVTRHVLIDGEVIRLGKSQIGFHAGQFFFQCLDARWLWRGNNLASARGKRSFFRGLRWRLAGK